ncbi:MAG TPA: bifunctional serine/threonine-protein kinase/formylglycine-generating enzyme family protein, partial [Thermoanaerobaculia bacterium]|nr:bifunctional serine/threonine-protein kinase/formylglycine-generating enzyme family protein [Thermoanaerobaculia bacterium]
MRESEPLSSDATQALSSDRAPRASGPASGTLRAGEMLDRFEVLELLGAGGFGEVYRARDQRLHRTVALKILPDSFAKDAERRERFRREAEAASALNHPGICTVHDLVEVDGRLVLVMELVPGRTLHEELAGGALAEERARDLALQLLDALGEAHRAGIVHRDVKASNVLVTPGGRAKLVDFGLAKVVASTDGLTAEGTALGTLHTMSPEQLLGRPLDARSDLFSFGVVLHEMLSGGLPFRGSNAVAVADAILHAPPESLAPTLPIAKGWRPVVERLLRKEPGERFASAEEAAGRIRALPIGPVVARRPRWPLVAAAVVLAVLAAFVFARQRRVSWARRTALPRVERLLADGKMMEAFALAREAGAVLPDDAHAQKLLADTSGPVNIESTPAGADVSYRQANADAAWTSLGTTPIQRALVPRELLVWRLEKAGFAPVFRIWPLWNRNQTERSFSAVLDRDGALPSGMVRVPGGRIVLDFPGSARMPAVEIDDYFMDANEVTNRDFKRFVDAGGYARSELWKVPFAHAGRIVAFEEAIASFSDKTGRPGPAAWELGACPPGEEAHPVSGVSFYEAAAYAAFAGKSLPTVYQWSRAAGIASSAVVSPRSNFAGHGTWPAGHGAMNAYGTHDMAGNVKEWCVNESDVPGNRYIMGGGWNELSYMFIDSDAQPAWDRKPEYGFRCVKPTSDLGLLAASAALRHPSPADWRSARPVSDEVFRAYKTLFE